MILTIAKDSLGYYYVGEDGRIYTRHSYSRHLSGVTPGERPTGREQQYAGSPDCVPYWLPTHETNPLEGEQLEILEQARDELDLRWMIAEARQVVACAECGRPATLDDRIRISDQPVFTCEERHLTMATAYA